MGRYKRKHAKHTQDDVNILNGKTDAKFRAFMEAHNAEIAEKAEEPEEVMPDEDFAEKHLIKMRRQLGVLE